MQIKKHRKFFGILSAFLIVILLVSAAFAGIIIDESKGAEAAALEKINLRFEHNSVEMKRVLSNIRYSMEELSVKIAASRDFDSGSYIDNNALRADMRAVFIDRPQSDFSKYIVTVFLVDTLKEGYIYELTGTHAAGAFYNRIFANETYNDEFWRMRTGLGKSFELFPVEKFNVTVGNEQKNKVLLPISYKPGVESRYIMVALLDMDMVAQDFEISAIRSEENGVIFADDSVLKNDNPEEILDSMKFRKGTVLKSAEKSNEGIELFKVISDSEVLKETERIDGFSLAIAVLFGVMALFLAVLFAVRYSGFLKTISRELLKNPEVKKMSENDGLSIKEIIEAVKMIASHKKNAAGGHASGESVLDTMLLQAHMRDVYVGVEDIESKIDYSRASFMAYFKISYRQEFVNFMSEDTGKATFLLKQLIESYLEMSGVDAIAFQTEQNGIAVVFLSDEKVTNIKTVIEEILNRLENESEYAYFTISVSKRNDSVLNIKEVYDTLCDLSKYGKLTTETQVLYEEEVQKDASRFYFSVEDMGKLSAVLQNGTEDDAVRKVDEIIDYNIRKDVNRFEMYLLCTEIVNCAVKLVNRVFYTLPKNIDIAAVYRNLEASDSPDEYRCVCTEFLHEMIEYIKENKREDDYIISYILDYVENHYAEDIYLNLFAEKLKLTGAYISSYFKEKMNVNLTDYINNYRIKKAVMLSENPQNKNKDIAEMVGLPNINTFIRLFKKYTGYTPGEYRKKHFGEEGKD